ncbi:unnamed protein product [Sphenostylis stenocarpa]|uniref:Secreted protein n=1 Tax=Sphenostylis stenocarpa TaxID=92480 RepID=A0AA86VD78_9FABA|nr:unnamed protein product [Sphenostylis stenocarpa]
MNLIYNILVSLLKLSLAHFHGVQKVTGYRLCVLCHIAKWWGHPNLLSSEHLLPASCSLMMATVAVKKSLEWCLLTALRGLCKKKKKIYFCSTEKLHLESED